ncbi:MAG: GNAT family N-acetyltransferase [Alphaproteobacteria bacterium]|nr:GNAT family N-acetyltransferase [Alphaproteobacteria bacterium SS10]
MTVTTKSTITAEELEEFGAGDLPDICEAAEASILDGGGFGWLVPPERDVFERFWRGVLVVPERHLFVGRADGVIAGSAQLIRAPKNNEAQAMVGNVTGMFVAPWARSLGVARRLLDEIIRSARDDYNLKVLNLDVRETQAAAIRLYEGMGFVQWGRHPAYAHINGRPVAGRSYYIDLTNSADAGDKKQEGA